MERRDYSTVDPNRLTEKQRGTFDAVVAAQQKNGAEETSALKTAWLTVFPGWMEGAPVTKSEALA